VNGVPFVLPVVLVTMAVGCASPRAARDISPPGPGPRSSAEAKKLVAEADRLYREPRTASSVEASLTSAKRAVLENDALGARWRAMRACCWLAQYHPDEDARLRYAQEGVAIGEEAVATAPSGPEPYFYHALDIGLLCDITGSGLFRIGTMRALAEKVIAIDPLYDHGGGHRFLGILCYRTASIPLFAAGTAEEGRAHLEKALEHFPDYGRNLLSLAEYHLHVEEPERARPYLERLLESPVPEDESAEHAEWLEKGRRHLEEIEEAEG